MQSSQSQFFIFDGSQMSELTSQPALLWRELVEIIKWEGKRESPFFVVPLSFVKIIRHDSQWVCPCVFPSFLSPSQAIKISVSGKCAQLNRINFIKSVSWSNNQMNKLTEAFSHLLVRRRGVSSEDVVVHTCLPQPKGEGALYKHRPARVMLGQELHLAWALDTWRHRSAGRKGNKDNEQKSGHITRLRVQFLVDKLNPRLLKRLFPGAVGIL